MIEEMSSTLHKLDDVTKNLQSDTSALSDARALFDCVIEEFPSVSNRFSATAPIIYNPEVETGIQKILDGEISGMSEGEIKATEYLKIRQEDSTLNSTNTALSFTERAL